MVKFFYLYKYIPVRECKSCWLISYVTQVVDNTVDLSMLQIRCKLWLVVAWIEDISFRKQNIFILLLINPYILYEQVFECVYNEVTKLSLGDVQFTLNLNAILWIHYQYNFIGFRINGQERGMSGWLNFFPTACERALHLNSYTTAICHCIRKISNIMPIFTYKQAAPAHCQIGFYFNVFLKLDSRSYPNAQMTLI